MCISIVVRYLYGNIERSARFRTAVLEAIGDAGASHAYFGGALWSVERISKREGIARTSYTGGDTVTQSVGAAKPTFRAHIKAQNRPLQRRSSARTVRPGEKG